MLIIWFIALFGIGILAINLGLGIRMCFLISAIDITIVWLLGLLTFWVWVLLLIICIEMLFIGKED